MASTGPPGVLVEGLGRAFYRLVGFIDADGEWGEDRDVPDNVEHVNMFVATHKFRIGRRNDAVTATWKTEEAVLIDNPKVSRHHADIELSPDGVTFRLVCLSKNGCDVNGVNLRANDSTPLSSGTRIRIGPLYVMFLLPRVGAY